MSWNIYTGWTEKIYWDNIYKQTGTKDIQQLGNEEIEQLFVPLKNIDRKKQDFIKFLECIIHHIHTLIKKERLENEYIENHLGKLSARQLLSTGKTFYMNPCLDFVLVTIEWLKKTWIEWTKLIIEELKCPWNWFKLHFGIEVANNGDDYHIDYRTKNDVFLGKGKFESDYKDKWEQIVNTIKINANNISTDDNIYTLIEKWLASFKFFDPKILEMLKEKLKKDNNIDQRKNWFVKNVKNIHQPEIFFKNNDQKENRTELIW